MKSLLIVLTLVSITLSGYSKADAVAETKAIERQAQASIVVNSVESKRPISRYRTVHKGKLFRAGETIQTQDNSLLQVILFNNRSFRVYPNTIIVLDDIKEDIITITLVKGKISIQPYQGIDNQASHYNYHIKTSIGSINSETGQDEFIVKFDLDKQESSLNVVQGSLVYHDLSSRSDTQVSPGYSLLSSSTSSGTSAESSSLDNDETNKKIERLLEESSALSSFDPLYPVSQNKEDPFFIQETTFEERRSNIIFERNNDHLYFIFDAGSALIENQLYLYYAFKPRIYIKPVDIQFRFSFYQSFDNLANYHKWYNYSEWDFQNLNDGLEDLFNKFERVSYGEKGDKVFFLIDEIEATILGHGLTVNRYNNLIEYPKIRKLGLQFDFDYDNVRLEGFIPDLTRTQIFAIRVESIPFYDSEEKYFDTHRFGMSIYMDFNPGGSHGNPQLYFTSVDLNIPLLYDPSKDVQATIYSEIGMQGYEFGDSITAGKYGAIAGKLNFINNRFGTIFGLKGRLFQYIDYRAEYRFMSNGFISEVLSPFYEIQRYKQFELLIAQDKTDYHGLLLGFGSTLPKLGKLYFEYYQESGSVPGLTKLNNRFHADLSSSSYLFPIFNVKLSYDRQNITSLGNFISSFIGLESILTGEIKYALSKNVDLTGVYRSFFINNTGSYSQSNYLNLYVSIIF